MTPTKKMIKAAIDGLHDEFVKEAVVPVQGGQIPPPQGTVSPPMPPGGDPGMGAPPGMPPGPPGAPPGMPPGMDPSMMGAPPPGGAPMDPMAGGAPMDPGMGPPPDAGAPPPPGGEGEEVASAQNTETAQQSGDVLVPVGAMTEMVTKVIEATKGKRTADPKDPNAPGAAGAGGAPAGPLAGMDPAVANIGGAPSDGGMAMPGMGAPPSGAPKMGAERISALEGIIARIEAHKRGQ